MRRIPPSLVFSLAVASVYRVASAEASVAAPSPAAVALVDGVNFTTAGIPKTVNERERFLVGFRQAVETKGWTTLAPVANESCAGVDDCLASVARLAKVDYALRLTGEGNLKYGYTLNLELYAVGSGQLHRTTAFCDICNTDRIADIAADLAVKLLAAAAQDRPVARPAEPAAHRNMVGAAAPTPHSVPGAAVPPARSDSAPVSWMPWAITALGVSGIAYGSWALAKDGDSSGAAYVTPAGTYVHEAYSSRTVGLAGVIGGGILAAAGIVWLVATPSRSTTLAASPTRVALAVRF